LEAFSETCEHCKGRGVTIQTEPNGGRNSIAEKVRAVAASSRAEQNGEAEGPAESEISGSAQAPEADATSRDSGAGGASADDDGSVEFPVARDPEDLAVDLDAPEEEEAAPS